MSRIVIPLDSGYRLIAEQNADSEFNKEMFIGIEDETGRYVQDLAVIRPTYHFENENVKFDSDKFELLIFGDADLEDYTQKFTVPLHKEEE